MKSLAQLRAAHALDHHGCTDKGYAEAVKKLPARICNDGLLPALAFALDKGGMHLVVVQKVAEHLAAKEIAIATNQEVRALVRELADGDALLLRRATAEALAFLNYLKRFVA